MHHTKSVAALTVLVLFMAYSAVCAAAPPEVETINIDAAAIQQDPRLEKPVTINGRHLSLKDALAKFSEQTGVSISIDDKTPASYYPVMIECRQTPLSKMMDAFYGLLSLRKHEWAWVRTRDEHGCSYALRQPAWAKDRMEFYTRTVAGMLPDFVDTMRRLAPMSMAERKLHHSALKEVLHTGDDKDLEVFFADETVWKQVEFFFTALSPDLRDAVLKGESQPLSLEAITPELASLFAQAVPIQNGESVPTTISFMISRPLGPLNGLAPKLKLTSGNGSAPWIGTGELENGIRRAIHSAWMLPEDVIDNPTAARVVQKTPLSAEAQNELALTRQGLSIFAASLPEDMPEDLRERLTASMTIVRYRLHTTLEQLSDGGNIPLVAIIEDGDHIGHSFAPPIGVPAQKTLDEISAPRTDIMYKWRNGILIVNHYFWFADP